MPETIDHAAGIADYYERKRLEVVEAQQKLMEAIERNDPPEVIRRLSAARDRAGSTGD